MQVCLVFNRPSALEKLCACHSFIHSFVQLMFGCVALNGEGAWGCRNRRA